MQSYSLVARHCPEHHHCLEHLRLQEDLVDLAHQEPLWDPWGQELRCLPEDRFHPSIQEHRFHPSLHCVHQSLCVLSYQGIQGYQLGL